MNSQPNHHNIQIIQHNCMKNRKIMLSLLHSSSLTTNIVIIQEPFIVRDTNSPGSWITVSHGSFERLIPSSLNPARTIIYITTSNLSLQCQPRPDIINNQEIQCLEIKTPSIGPIILIHVYNEQIQASVQQPNTSNKHTIERTVTDLLLPTRCIIAGDFDAQHPRWD